MRFMAAVDGKVQGVAYEQGEEIPAETVASWSTRFIQRMLSKGLIAPFVQPADTGPGIPLGGLPGQYLGIDEEGDLAYFNLVAPEVYRRVWAADVQYTAGELVNSGVDLWAARIDSLGVLPTATRTYSPDGSDAAGAGLQTSRAEYHHPIKLNADKLVGAFDLGMLGDPGQVRFYLSSTIPAGGGAFTPAPLTAIKTMQPANVGSVNNITWWRLILDDPIVMTAGVTYALVSAGMATTAWNGQLALNGTAAYTGVMVQPTTPYGAQDLWRNLGGSWAGEDAFRRQVVRVVSTQEQAWDRIASRV